MATPILTLLNSEAVFGKTPTGRQVGESMIFRVKNCVNNPNPEDTQYMNCLNCGFVLEEQYFLAGCPNCGCKDVDTFSSVT